MVTYTNEQVQLQCAAKSLTNAQIFGSLQVQGGGNGYTSAPSVSITGGGGTGATATTSITGPVTGVAVTNGGSGYTSAPTVSFSGGGGSGAQATAIIYGGQVTAIRVTNGGTNYTSPPSVSFSGGGGSGATAQATMSVQGITLTNPGSGYTSHPTVTISAPTGPGGGLTATAYAKTNLINNTVESIFLAGDVNSLKGLSFLDFKDSSTNNFSDMFVITSYDNFNSPLLTITQGVIMEKDLMAGGLLDSGQGALWLNHGLVGRPILSSPPCIAMISSGIQYPSGTSLPPDPEKGQLFNHNGVLKMWNGSSWITGPFTGYYDTLFLFKSDGVTLANMYLDVLTSWRLNVKSTNNVFAVTAGDNGANQDTFLVPQNPSQGGLGLGTAAYPFKWVDATSVFTNGINSLSGGAISVYVSLIPYLTGSRDLGSDSYRWNYGWIQYLRSAELRPYVNGTGYVGTSSYKFGTGYINKIYGTVGDPEPLPEPLKGIEDLKMVKFRDDGLPLETSLPEAVRLSAAVVRRQLEAERLEKPSEEEVEAVVEANVDTVNLSHVIGWLMQCCHELTQRLETLEEQLKKNVRGMDTFD